MLSARLGNFPGAEVHPRAGITRTWPRHCSTDTVRIRCSVAAGYRARQVTALLYHQAVGGANSINAWVRLDFEANPNALKREESKGGRARRNQGLSLPHSCGSCDSTFRVSLICHTNQSAVAAPAASTSKSSRLASRPGTKLW